METKDRLIKTATRLFAERGFYGVSIAVIAEELSITKQALLYHFGTKEKLYDAVLRTISEDTITSLSSYQSEEQSPADNLTALFLTQFDYALQQPASSRVILRELLDNKQRAASVQDWVLKPYLDGVADLVGRVPGLEGLPWATRFSFAYQIQGSILYFMISIPTLENMYGQEQYQDIESSFRSVIKSQIDRFLQQGH